MNQGKIVFAKLTELASGIPGRTPFFIILYIFLRNITENRLLHWFPKMTMYAHGAMVTIPLHTYVKNIIYKYDGKAPKVYANQPRNRYLKIIARLAGLTDKSSKSITRSGEKETKLHFKWELVTVHIAGRSFCTNLFEAGIEPTRIMYCSGHTTEKSFKKYVKSDSKINARFLSGHEVFQGLTSAPPVLRIAK